MVRIGDPKGRFPLRIVCRIGQVFLCPTVGIGQFPHKRGKLFFESRGLFRNLFLCRTGSTGADGRLGLFLGLHFIEFIKLTQNQNLLVEGQSVQKYIQCYYIPKPREFQEISDN